MGILFYGLALFLIAFFVQLVIWKIRLPRNQIKALLQIFFLVLAIGVSILFKSCGSNYFFGIALPRTMFEITQLSLLFISLTLAYMVTYSAIEVDSPSLVMILNVAEAGRAGLDKKSFEEKMNDNILVKPRIKDLLTGGLAYLDEGRYRLTPKGALLAGIFIKYRKLIGTTEKGG